MTSVKINLYPFAALEEKAKEKAKLDYCILTTQDNWYEFIYEDAKNVGIEITAFDLDYKGSIAFNLLFSSEYIADKILENHGETCDTYKHAESFRNVFNKFEEKYRTVPGGSFKDDIEDEEFTNDYEEITAAFRQDLKQDYLKMLKDEYEYLTSEEYAIENIEANDYFFFKDGTMANTTTYVQDHPRAGQTELKLHGETYILE